VFRFNLPLAEAQLAKRTRYPVIHALDVQAFISAKPELQP